MQFIWILQVLGVAGAAFGGVLPIGHGCPKCQVTSIQYSPLPAAVSASLDSLLLQESRVIPQPTPKVTSPVAVQVIRPICVPHSICVDGFSCGVRWGGCYDELFCDGNTSPIPIPTCTPDPIRFTAIDREEPTMKSIEQDGET